MHIAQTRMMKRTQCWVLACMQMLCFFHNAATWQTNYHDDNGRLCVSQQPGPRRPPPLQWEPVTSGPAIPSDMQLALLGKQAAALPASHPPGAHATIVTLNTVSDIGRINSH